MIYDATERMIRKKPILEKLHLDLKAVESPAEKSQANKIARSIKKLDLTHLAINFSVKKDSELPILDRRHTNDKLVELKIHGLSQGRSIFKHIQNTSALRVLDIEDMHFERSDFQLIEALLKANPDLNTIRFNTTNIGQIDSPLLINSLRLLPHLAYLDLSDCNLGRTTIMPLCDLISRNPDHLIELNLANNAFVSSDAIKLADSFLFNNKIEKLNLDGNYIENDGMLEFLEIIKIGRHITTLLMSNNCRYTLSDDTLGSLCLILADPDCALEELGFEQHNSIKQLEQLKDAIVSNSSLIKVTLNYKTNVIWGALYKKIIQDHINGLTPLVNNRAHIIKTWGSAASLPKEETPPVSIGKAKEAFFATDDDTEDDGYGYHPLWQLGKKIGSQPIVPVTVQSGMSKS